MRATFENPIPEFNCPGSVVADCGSSRKTDCASNIRLDQRHQLLKNGVDDSHSIPVDLGWPSADGEIAFQNLEALRDLGRTTNNDREALGDSLLAP